MNNVTIIKADSSNSSCELLCTAKPSSGEASLNYVWIKNGQFLSHESHLTVSKSDLSHSYTCNASNPVSWKITTVKAEDICKGKGLNSWYTSETQFGRQQSGFGVEYGKEACKPERFILEFNIASWLYSKGY